MSRLKSSPELLGLKRIITGNNSQLVFATDILRLIYTTGNNFEQHRVQRRLRLLSVASLKTFTGCGPVRGSVSW